MRVLLAQINPTVGDLKGNAGKIIKILTNLESDIYVFPELCITGYIPQDLLLRSRFITQNLDILRWIIEKSGSKALVLGFVDRAGGKLYNGAAIVQKGKLTGIYHKQCIPNYHIFESVAVWDKQITDTRTGLRPYKNQRSLYCYDDKCITIFDDLITNAKCKFILFSYNTEDICDHKFINL